jgi:enterochelin esterase family protein
MNRFSAFTTTLLLMVVTASCDNGRTAVKEDFSTSPNVQLGQNYPMVNSERRVRVRVFAPKAKSVKLDISARLYELKKDREGYWTGESNPQDEGFHYYQLNIDGANVPDPSSVYYYGAARWGSGVDVPAPDDSLYEVRNVPQGQTRSTYYWSEVTQKMRHCFIYTPAGYDLDPGKRYPVLYLLPGGAENEYSWALQGHAAQIMDNLLAAGKAKPFIIVMENGQTEDPWGWEENFDDMLINDLIPMVDSCFRTIPDKDHRAFAGLSYGGLQCKWTVFAHPELFSYVGMFSGGTIKVDEARENPAFADGMKLVFISFGSRELTEPIFGIEEGEDPCQETEDLDASGVNAVIYLSPNTHHEWHSWRRSLYEFAQLIFREQ